MIKKTNAKQIRYDDDIYEGLRNLSRVTGFPVSEIVRRMVRFTYNDAIDRESLDFLYGEGFNAPEVLGEMAKTRKKKNR